MPVNLPTISIIISTYNRVKTLEITVESFINQNYPKDRYEIIIVDNNSSDNTKEIVSKWQKKYPSTIKYIFEKRQGLHYARNTGAKNSRGGILYYTDDDMIADENLLINLVRIFLTPNNVACATGRVLPKWETEPPEWVLKYCCNPWLSLIDRGDGCVIAPFDIGVFGCHQAVLRHVFFKTGGFNPEVIGTEWIGDGDTGLNIKIKELGYNFAYIGDSIIYHVIPPSRMTQKYLNKRLANQGNSDSYTAYKKNKFNKKDLCNQILSHIKNLVINASYFLFNFVIFKDIWRIYKAYVSYYFNRIKYDYKLIKDEDWRQMVLKDNWLNE